MRDDIDSDAAGCNTVFRCSRMILCAAQHGADTGADLFDTERLDDVIVCAQFKPQHFIDLGTTGGEQQNGNTLGLRFAAQRAADGKAVRRGHHPVKNQCIWPAFFNGVQQGCSVGKNCGFKAFVFETECNQFTNVGLIVCNIYQCHSRTAFLLRIGR